MRKLLGYAAFLLLASSSGSCAGSDREPLTGRYFLAQTEDGDPMLYFDDPDQGVVVLASAMATGVGKGYIAACWDSCYIFAATAASSEAARRSRIGPLTEAACQQKVFQLTGDSLQLVHYSL